MGQSVLQIIKGSLGLVIPKERSVLIQEMHITMHFLYEVAHETVKKFFLPLQTLEFSNVGWGG